MTPEEMRERSSAKMKQVLDLMRVLSVRVEARQRVDENGFIELMPFWIDEGKYQPAAGPIPQSVIDKELAGPVGGTPGIPTFSPTAPKEGGTE